MLADGTMVAKTSSLITPVFDFGSTIVSTRSTVIHFEAWAFPEVQNPWLSVEDARDVGDQEERGRLESELSLSLHIISTNRFKGILEEFPPAFCRIKPPSKGM